MFSVQMVYSMLVIMLCLACTTRGRNYIAPRQASAANGCLSCESGQELLVVIQKIEEAATELFEAD